MRHRRVLGLSTGDRTRNIAGSRADGGGGACSCDLRTTTSRSEGGGGGVYIPQNIFLLSCDIYVGVQTFCFENISLLPKPPPKILLPSARHLEERLKVSQSVSRQASSQ